MSNKDQLFYIRKRLFKSKNIIFIFIMTLVITIIISCLTMINFVYNFKIDSLNEEHGRTLIINNPKSEEDLQKIKSIKHIELVESQKYLYGNEKETTYKGKNFIDGKIYLLPLLKEDDIKIKLGRNLENEGEAVCSQKFYPKSLYTDSFVKLIDNSSIMYGKEIINKNFRIELNEDNNSIEKDFKIVGTYNNKELTELNICYISKLDYDKIANNYKTISGYIDENGNEVFVKNPYTSSIVRVDNYKNMDNVIKELDNLGYASIKVLTQDEQFLGYMINIPLFIALIVIIIAINIIYNFIKKKSKYNRFNYGILKTCGFTNNDILKLTFKENLLLYIISLIISLIIYFIGFIIIQKVLLVEFIYMNYNLKVPYFYLLIFIISFIILISLFGKKITTKTLNNNVQELLGE